jgi:hypothetical protein
VSGATGSAAELGRDVSAAVEAVRRSGSHGRAGAERGCRRGGRPPLRPLGQPPPEIGRDVPWNGIGTIWGAVLRRGPTGEAAGVALPMVAAGCGREEP